jgi:hypothetical protein
MFEVDGSLFLSIKGELLGRVEGYVDQRITQRLILQPRIELNFAAQDIPESDIGAGLVDGEVGAACAMRSADSLVPMSACPIYARQARPHAFLVQRAKMFMRPVSSPVLGSGSKIGGVVMVGGDAFGRWSG